MIEIIKLLDKDLKTVYMYTHIYIYFLIMFMYSYKSLTKDYMNIMRNARNTKELNGIHRAKNTIPQMKNSLDGIKSRLDIAEEKICDF